jgi:GTP-binding protein
VALSKCDALDKETLAERAEALKKAAKKKPLLLSAVSGEGVREALFALAREISRGKSQDAAEAHAPKQRWRP